MGQQVEYPAIPGTEPKDYPAIIRALLAYIVRESPTDKELRRYMRSRSFYDKETADLLFDLLGIVAPKGGNTSLNEFGRKLYDADDDKLFARLLFMQIADRNEILTKYVFDALEERLYSVNEMYRVLTSYVYPGKAVTLVHFKNWMALVEATGMLKYIGIRWGPSPALDEVREYLNGIDIEEVLEDEAGEAEDWDDSELDDFTLPSEQAEAAAAPAQPTATAEAPAEAEAEDLPDMPDVPDAPPTPPAPTAASGCATLFFALHLGGLGFNRLSA